MSTVRRPHRRSAPREPEPTWGNAGIVRLETPLLRLPATVGTLDGFCGWATSDAFPRGLRASFLDGEILLDMSPENLQTHAPVKGEVSRGIMNLNRELRLGRFFPDGCLIRNEAANLSTEPDATFVTYESVRTGRVRFTAGQTNKEGQLTIIEGTPDWVLEVVSAYNPEKDTDRLRALYHRAGIPEYWLIDARGAAIDFQILVYHRDGYRASAVRGGWRRSPVFDRRFRLDRLRDEAGLWDDMLQVR